jgi:hypothetical protein|eukprot:COSAG06_NODE_598_length_13910_cov_8.818406_4_plen_73_part_00
MNSRVGLLDLPLSSMRPVLELLQQENKLGVNQAHSREYVFYCTFQMELYAYQTIGESLSRVLPLGHDDDDGV